MDELVDYMAATAWILGGLLVVAFVWFVLVPIGLEDSIWLVLDMLSGSDASPGTWGDTNGGGAR